MRDFIRTGLENWRVSREHSNDLAKQENATSRLCLTWGMSESGWKKRGRESERRKRHGIREAVEHPSSLRSGVTEAKVAT